MLRLKMARSSSWRLMLLIALCICVLQAAAFVHEKGKVSVGQLTVPEIEDKLQVRQSRFPWHSYDCMKRCQSFWAPY